MTKGGEGTNLATGFLHAPTVLVGVLCSEVVFVRGAWCVSA
jgi:hypothetical protein